MATQIVRLGLKDKNVSLKSIVGLDAKRKLMDVLSVGNSY